MKPIWIPGISFLFLLILVFRCDDATGPESLPLIDPPRLSVNSLEITDYPGLISIWVRVSGKLQPGRQADGSPGVVTDRCLYVLGFGFCPPNSRYDAAAWLPESAFETQRFLRAPVVEGVRAAELSWSLPHRAGPDSLFVRSTEKPVLRLTRAQGGAETAITGWQLYVPIVPPPFRGPPDRIALSGSGPPPPEITIPDDVFPLSERTVVTLSYGIEFGDDTARMGEYIIGGYAEGIPSIGSVYHQWVLIPTSD